MARQPTRPQTPPPGANQEGGTGAASRSPVDSSAPRPHDQLIGFYRQMQLIRR